MPAPDRLARWRAGLTRMMLAALAILLFHHLVGLGDVGEATIGRFADDAVVILAAALCLLRAFNEPGQRGAWLLLCGALAAWSASTAYQSLVL